MLDQLILDVLLPAGRTKFSIPEVCRILGVDGEPLSERTVRAAIESGQLGGNRLPLGARPGEEKRIKIEWVLRDDLALYILRTRTLPATEHLTRILGLFDNLPSDALDHILRHATGLRQRAARR